MRKTMTMNQRSYVLIGIIMMVGCAPKPSAPPTPAKKESVAAVTPVAVAEEKREADACPDEANLAVLNKVYPLLGNTPETVAGLNRYDLKIRCLREWAETLKNACMRSEYISWLNFYQGASNRARANIAEQRNPKESDYERERKEKDRRVAQYERTHVIPAPAESCERSVIDRVKPEAVVPPEGRNAK